MSGIFFYRRFIRSTLMSRTEDQGKGKQRQPMSENLSLTVTCSYCRLTMQKYGIDFKTFFVKSSSQLFQRLAQLIEFVPSLTIGQQQALGNK